MQISGRHTKRCQKCLQTQSFGGTQATVSWPFAARQSQLDQALLYAMKLKVDYPSSFGMLPKLECGVDLGGAILHIIENTRSCLPRLIQL